MGKGDIRTRRGKVWRGTYGVTRPRRWKVAPRPAATTRKVKTLKDLPKEMAVEQPIKKIVIEETESLEKAAVSAEAETPVVETAFTDDNVELTDKKEPLVKKAPTAKKVPAVKKAPVKKK